MDKIRGTQKENKIDLIQKLRNIAKTGPDIRTSWEKDVNIMRGAEGALTIWAEYKKLNQFKGHLSAWVGEIFADIIKNDLKALQKVFGKVATEKIKGSPTILQDIEKQLVDTLDPSKKRKKGKRTVSKAAVLAKGVHTKSASRTKLRKPKARREVKKDRSSIVNLIGILNNKIENTVAKNMKAPALVYRSGRFANSVEITDIAVTPQGFPSIGYTYQRRPYDTFEPGGAQGSPERDPRKLIDASIREIAMNLAIGRFYTRRV